jgi:hypothetical protein
LAAGIAHDMTSKAMWESAGRWMLANLITERVGRRLQMLRIRYEDLVGGPLTQLQRIGRFTGLDLDRIARCLLNGDELPIQHQIAGNRLRMSGHVRLQPDWEWLDRLSQADRRVCWGLAGWVAARYGYSREVPGFQPGPPQFADSAELKLGQRTMSDLERQVPCA